MEHKVESEQIINNAIYVYKGGELTKSGRWILCGCEDTSRFNYPSFFSGSTAPLGPGI
jgi:hypothetical protein